MLLRSVVDVNPINLAAILIRCHLAGSKLSIPAPRQRLLQSKIWPQRSHFFSLSTKHNILSNTSYSGYPVPYVPFSVNLPDQFRDLRRRQESYGLSNTTSWWTCDASMSTADGDQVLAVSESTNIGSIIELEQELSAAMDSPLQSNAHTAAPRSELNTCKPLIKTSSTHPLK